MCAYCPQHATVAFEYFLLLVATILRLINAFLIWRLLNESLNFRGQQAEGSDYVEVLVTVLLAAHALKLGHIAAQLALL